MTTRRSLYRALQRALLLGSPLALADCILGQSSCPDNGYEPPRAELRAIQAGFANNGALSADDCRAICTENDASRLVTCVRQSETEVLCINRPPLCEGRRPPGLRQTALALQVGFDCHLADAAWLEAASVDAFRVLRRELRAHGAPRRLLRAASRSARDERRHARATRALARRFGVAVPVVERDRTGLRSLAELALENAVEGCVRETWGALVAMRQATRASEPSVRAAMAGIARDEVRHAELAFRIDRWLRPRLSAEATRRVREARSAALDELEQELQYALPRAERERLGLPGSQEATAMLGELTRALGLQQSLAPHCSDVAT